MANTINDETHAANIDRLHDYFTGILIPTALLDIHWDDSMNKYVAVLYNGQSELHVECDAADLDE